MSKLSIFLILILAFSMVLVACADTFDATEDKWDAKEEELDEEWDAKENEWDVKYGLLDGDDDNWDDWEDEAEDEWDDIEDEWDDEFDDDVDVDVDVDVDDDVDVDVDADADADVDVIADEMCNALYALENSVVGLLGHDLITPEAYSTAFDIVRDDYRKLRESANGQYQTEFDGVKKAAAGFDALLSHASDVEQRANIIVQGARITYAVNVLKQVMNCGCAP